MRNENINTVKVLVHKHEQFTIDLHNWYYIAQKTNLVHKATFSFSKVLQRDDNRWRCIRCIRNATCYHLSDVLRFLH